MATMVPFFFQLSILLIIIASGTAYSFTASGTASGANVVDFTETQDVEILDKVTYPQFLQRIRDKLGKLPGATNIEGVPVLPPQDKKNPKRWFDLKLKGKDGKETTVRFRGDSLYVVGYQMHDTQQWLEFGKKGDRQYITGSEFLNFRDNYNDLVSAASVKSLTQVSLTKSTLSKATKTLAESTDYSKRADALIVIILMVSEACRFDDISIYFTTNFDQSLNLFQWWMQRDLVNNWGSLSTIVIKAKKCPRYKYETQTINGQQIKTAADLRKRLHLILRTTDSEDCNKRLHLILRTTDSEDCNKSFLDAEAMLTG